MKKTIRYYDITFTVGANAAGIHQEDSRRVEDAARYIRVRLGYHERDVEVDSFIFGRESSVCPNELVKEVKLLHGEVLRAIKVDVYIYGMSPCDYLAVDSHALVKEVTRMCSEALRVRQVTTPVDIFVQYCGNGQRHAEELDEMEARCSARYPDAMVSCEPRFKWEMEDIIAKRTGELN